MMGESPRSMFLTDVLEIFQLTCSRMSRVLGSTQPQEAHFDFVRRFCE